jgi:hypothetical protein
VIATLASIGLTRRRGARRFGWGAARRSGWLIGLLTASVGGGALVVRLVVPSVTRAGVAALNRHVGGWPPSVRLLLTDVLNAVSGTVDGALRRAALPWLVVGLAVAAAAVVVGPALAWARTPRRVLVPAGVALGLSIGLGALPVPLPSPLSGSLSPGVVGAYEPTCNGFAELCDRPYDRVVQAASHNAMAASDYRFLAPVQDLDLTGQLELGVRALLLDTHYWEPPSVTDRYLADLPAPLAARIRALLASRLARRPGTWLCHNVCALGAVPLDSGFAEVAGFLDQHPGNVVTLVLQDDVSPADTETALRHSGLLDRVATPPPPGQPWPTLGQMIADGRNVVVFAESAHDPSRPWYPNFFDYAMDTPYNAGRPESLSCAPNRGGRDKALFLVNRWVTRTGAGRDEAARVNQRSGIVDQARRCAEVRGTPPTMIAVDFADTGDVVGAVNELNRRPLAVDARSR